MHIMCAVGTSGAQLVLGGICTNPGCGRACDPERGRSDAILAPGPTDPFLGQYEGRQHLEVRVGSDKAASTVLMRREQRSGGPPQDSAASKRADEGGGKGARRRAHANTL